MAKNTNFRLAVFVLSVFLLLAGSHLFISAQNISLKYEGTDLKVKLNELVSRNWQLGGQVARQENLGAIEKSARGSLGMIYPEQVIYIRASKEASPALPKTASTQAMN